MPPYKHMSKRDWLIPTGLLALSFVPIVAGTVRVLQLSTGAAVTLDDARFVASPLPVVMHILSGSIYCVLGSFQFSPSLRRRRPHWHRISGWVLVPCGLLVAFTGLWMTQFYPIGIDPPANFDGTALYVIRLVVGSAMALFLCLGVAAILRRDVPHHQAWMMRSYALGLGAGTQVLTHLPWFLFPGIQGQLTRTLCMAAGWAVNLAVAEWLISRPNFKPLAAV
jgi:multisubunit Na+/H+ antiporter MnhB subunit